MLHLLFFLVMGVAVFLLSPLRCHGGDGCWWVLQPGSGSRVQGPGWDQGSRAQTPNNQNEMAALNFCGVYQPAGHTPMASKMAPPAAAAGSS